ncbi:MAG: hypothetical protein Q9209_003624 [Squamulea sp. 1 TL-2023]
MTADSASVLSSLQDHLQDDDGPTRVRKLKDYIISSAWDRLVPEGPIKAIRNTEDPRTCRAPAPKDDNDVSQPCQAGVTTVSNDKTVMGDCFIDTVTPSINRTPTPELQCSCAGGMVAGVGSTEFLGTKYTWCQTGGPEVYPTGMQTSISPSATPTTVDLPASPPADDIPEKPQGNCDGEGASPLASGSKREYRNMEIHSCQRKFVWMEKGFGLSS